MRFAAMVRAHKRSFDAENNRFVQNNNHRLFMVDAASQEEAEGKCWRFVHFIHPEGEGWHGHFVMVCTPGDENVLNPESTWKR